MPRCQSRPAATLMFLLLVAVPLPISVLAGGLPPSGTQGEFSVTELAADYSGELGFLIEQGVAEPLSLAAADFDEDGMPDLVVGYGDGDAGLIALHLANVEAVYPSEGTLAEGAFLPHARVFAGATRPEHMATGDFDADGHVDIVAATTGGTTLELHRGDGAGLFAAAETFELGGRLMTLAAGEVNRRDNLTDVVVGVDRPSGPKIMVFESPLGALWGAPEIIDVYEAVDSIELGNFDDDWNRDISATTESYLIHVPGRDRRLSLGQKQRAEVAEAVAIAEPLAESTRATKRGTPSIAELFDAEIVAQVSMRLNRDAIPDTVAIIEGRFAPVVVKTTTRATYTVDSTADDSDFSTADGVCDTDNSVGDGPCTLRAAIEQANANPGADAVDFNIPGPGPHTITPVTSYFEILFGQPLTIDGYTQPGAAVNTNPPGQGTNAVIMIEIIGPSPNVYNGISVRAEGSVVRGLSINRINGTGIGWFTENGSIVEGNFIGTDPTGTIALGNAGVGVFMGTGNGHLLGGTAPAARNIISANGSHGIYVLGPSCNDHQILGNLIGTDATGESDFGNTEYGVYLHKSSGNTLGGSAPGAGNLISGNDGIQIYLYQTPTDDNVFQGNFIGSNLSGDTIVGCGSNSFTTVSYTVNTLFGGTAGTTPGGACTGACNLIVGCSFGPTVSSSESATFQGNFIGVDASGTTSLGITHNGITLSNTLNTVVGGAVAEARNIISGNNDFGIKLNHGSFGVNTTIQGNFIGTDTTGMIAIPNGDGNDYWGGIYIEHSNGVTVGGPNPGEGNLISGNNAQGIRIYGSQPVDSDFQGNLIGVDASGTGPLPNTFAGIYLEYNVANNTFGGTAPGEGNTIAFNGDGGIVFESNAGSPNTISGNSIFGNTGLGIDINKDGVTANDPDDPDAGPNNLQNYPVITAVSGLTITGNLDSLPDTIFDLEFFSSTACDPSTYGEGEQYLGSGTTTTDVNGDAAFAIAVTTPPPTGSFVTATATNPDGDTSEFSACFQYLVEADVGITKDDGVTTATPGEALTYTIVAGNAGPDDLTGAAVADLFPPELSCSWTCFAGGGASCTAGPVVGDISDSADLPVGGTATYTAVCDVAPSASGTISNTATVTAPAGVTDPTPGNNSATDIDNVLELDLGDAPDPTYPTLHASDGARHVLGGALYLGASVDADPDGQPTADADGDDTDGTDDEDGVVFTSPLVTGYTADIDVTASAAGLLNAWIDFNADGDWDDAGEQFFTDEPLVAGVNPLGITVPAAAVLGDTFARFRVDTTGGLAPTGLASDGEVEDYGLEIRSTFTDIPLTGQTISYAAGDDGTYQAGIDWPEPRFIDHGDGTITDELTGLMWTQDNVTPGPPACNPGIQKNWWDSFTHIDCLNAEAYLGHTDWRLPNVIEIHSLAHLGETDQRPWLASQGFTLSPYYYWWSSTTPASSLSGAFTLSSQGASYGGYNKNSTSGPTVWPVRGSTSDGIAPLRKTGQVRCWNSSYAEIPCAGTGQDGDHRAGMEWPSPRFEVGGDCVTDRMTGLMWTKDGNIFGSGNWADAIANAEGLALCGHDDWRLASKLESDTLIHFDRRMGTVPPTMTEWWESQGFVNTSQYQSWTGTTEPYAPNSAYKMQGASNKTSTTYVTWPVRGNLHTIGADLSVDLTDSPDPIAAGGTLTYTVTASNFGPATVDQVTVTTTLDGAAVFVGASGSGWTCGEDTGVVTCTYGSLAVESAPPISIEITTPNTPGATLTSSALVDSPLGDPVPDNNAAEADTEILGQDFGDASDPTYPTLLSSDGARHAVGGALFLGATVDSDPDGQPTAGADGDDLDGTDDEDGVVFTSALRLGLDASVSVEASTAGLLNAWIDFNADGDWDDAGEQIFTDTPLTAGTNNLSAAVPIDATLGATFARFRVDSTGGLTPIGAAADGEVEDYALTIEPSAEPGVNIGDSPDPVRQGRRLTYSVAVDNNGGLDATGVVLTDTLDGNVSFVSASLPVCSETGGVVTCSLDTLSAGTSAMVFIEVDVNPTFTGTLTNTAVVALNEEDPVPANNTDTETTTVVAPGPHIFSDGFETGDADRWDASVGG